jgi:hypothetical protein
MNVIHFTATGQTTHSGFTPSQLWRWGVGIGVGLNIVLGFWYLLLLNSIATQGFGLESLKAEKLKISKQGEDLDIALAIPNSLYALESNEKVQSLIPITHREFVSVRDQTDMAFMESKPFQ